MTVLHRIAAACLGRPAASTLTYEQFLDAYPPVSGGAPRTLADVISRMVEVRTEIETLAALEELDDTQHARWNEINTEWDALDGERTTIEARNVRLDAVRQTSLTPAARTQGDDPGANRNINVNRDETPFDVLERTRGMGAQEHRRAVTDAITRAVEDTGLDESERAELMRKVRRHGGDRQWAEQLLARMSPDYVSAFSKYATGNSMALTEEERTALSVGSNTNGGFMVPTYLDPTLILTNSGAENPIRAISHVVTLTGGANTWRGITSAGVTASWDGELVEVSDDTPTVAAVSIPIFKAQAFVQGSIEAFEDIPNLEADLRMLLADAKDRLESAAFATGNGTTQPKGIFTALNANTNTQVTSTTAATIGEVDIHALYRALPVRWRGNGSWAMNPLYSLAIKRLGTAVSSTYSGDLTVAPTDMILGHRAIEWDDAPTTQTTTALDNEIVFGDFRNYVIVDKPGSFAIEFIPQLFNTANNLPDGRRGLYAHWRTGADAVNPLAFRMLVDRTSA